MARIRSTTQAESNRLGELLGAVIDSERQQGMSTPLILSESARPSRTVSQSSTDFFGMRLFYPIEYILLLKFLLNICWSYSCIVQEHRRLSSSISLFSLFASWCLVKNVSFMLFCNGQSIH